MGADGTLRSEAKKKCAGIGGGGGHIYNGNITINGGRIYAQGGDHASGIGSGAYSNQVGTITINCGTVEAQGGKHGAGIGGGGNKGDGGWVYIRGRDTVVTARGGTCCSAGIGGGDDGEGPRDLVVESGAHVYAYGTANASGIGAGGYEDALHSKNDNTLTVNIGRLRKKLDAAGLTDFIKTKFGVGYCIE